MIVAHIRLARAINIARTTLKEEVFGARGTEEMPAGTSVIMGLWEQAGAPVTLGGIYSMNRGLGGSKGAKGQDKTVSCCL